MKNNISDNSGMKTDNDFDDVVAAETNVDLISKFSHLKVGMTEENLMKTWPSFFVALDGSVLHTMDFISQTESIFFEGLGLLGSLIKRHYSDWIDNPAGCPKSVVGGAIVIPAFTAKEFKPLVKNESKIKSHIHQESIIKVSRLWEVMTNAVVRFNRCVEWLLLEEKDRGISGFKY